MERRSLLLCISALIAGAPCHAETQRPEPPKLELLFQASRPSPVGPGYVQFVGYQDTRCPSNVACAVAGEAHVFLWLTDQGSRGQVVTLPWTGSASAWERAVRAGKYEYLLVGLEPRPIYGASVDPSAYKAVVAMRPRRP